MVEILVAARDLDTGYTKGDLLTILPGGWVWGTKDTLPNNWQIAISGVPTALVLPLIQPLVEPMIILDPEWEDEADPEDRVIRRHRAMVRVMWDEIAIDHPDWMTTLDTVGRLELRKNQLRPYVRVLRWNRGQGKVEKTDTRIM